MNRWIRVVCMFLLVGLVFFFFTRVDAAPPPPKDDGCNENPFIVDTNADVTRVANGYHCENAKVIIKKLVTSVVPALVVEAADIEIADGVTIQNTLPGSKILLHARRGNITVTNAIVLANKDVTLKCESMGCAVLGLKKNILMATYVTIWAMERIWMEGTDVTAGVDAIFRTWHDIEFYQSRDHTMPMVTAKNIIMQTEGDVSINDWVFLKASNRLHMEGASVWVPNSNLYGGVIEIFAGTHIELTNAVALSKGRFAAYVNGVCAQGVHCISASRADIYAGSVLEMGTPKSQGTIHLCRGKFKDEHPRVPRMNRADTLPYPLTIIYSQSQCPGVAPGQID